MKNTDKESLCKALDAVILALDDWTNTYASDFCDETRVVEAWKRIKDNGGTIAYIADTVQQCREAKKVLK